MALKDRKAKRGDNRRLLRLGVIRLGHKESKTYESGRAVEYPVQDDHFVIKDAPEIAQAYGPEPRELDVLFPFPDIARNFDAFYMVWAGGVPICKGDGEQVLSAWPHRIEKKPVMRGKEKVGERTAVHNAPGEPLVDNGVALREFDWNGAHFNEGDVVPCPGADANLYPHCAACKASGTLKVMIAHPDIFRFGYYQISTGSGRNYDHINDTLEAVYEAAGQVSAIPFKLRMVKQSATYLEAGQRKQTEKYFLQLEPPAEIMLTIIGRQREGLLRPALTVGPAVDNEPDYEVEDLAPPPYAEEGGPAEEVIEGDYTEAETAERENPTGEPGAIDGAQLEADIARAVAVVAEAVKPFESPEKAYAWAVSTGAFGAGSGAGIHARNAYDKLKKTAKPATSIEMARLWRADVARRLAETVEGDVS